LLLAKLRPSERKLNTGFPPPGRAGGKLKFIRAELDYVAGCAHDWTLVIDADVVGERQVDVGLLGWNAKVQRLHHLAVLSPPDVLLVVVAHRATITMLGSMVQARLASPPAGPGWRLR
jgi:hypothetical protein